MKIRALTSAFAFMGGAAGLCPPAVAQDVSQAPTIGTAFDRTRTTAVADQVVPGYEPAGVRLGQWLLSPEIDAGAIAVDNLYVQALNREADLAAIISPGFSLVSDTSVNHMVVQAKSTHTWFASHGTENSNLVQGSVQERYNFSPELTGYVYAGFRQSQVPRTDPGSITGLNRPLIVSAPSGEGQLTWTQNRIRIAVEGNYTRFNFSDLSYNSGLVAAPLGLNRHQEGVMATAEYALNADIALLAQARLEHIDYEDVGTDLVLNKSSVKHEMLIGSSFELTDFVRGEVALGYINQIYSSSLYRNFSGFGGRIKIQLFPTRLTTVELDLSRTIKEAASILDSSYVASAVSLKLDHALFRNVILSPSAGYSRNSFSQVGRIDTQIRLGFGVNWMLDRNFTVQSQYQFVDSDTNSSSSGRSFTINQIVISAAYKY